MLLQIKSFVKDKFGGDDLTFMVRLLMPADAGAATG
jgi:hypothetical protein